MNRTGIDSYLRDNKPQVKNDPTFLLEVERKMREVDGIKGEVDRQRRREWITMAVVFAAGIIIGTVSLALVLSFPTDHELTDFSLLAGLKAYFEAHAEQLLIPVALGTVFMSIMLGIRKENSH